MPTSCREAAARTAALTIQKWKKKKSKKNENRAVIIYSHMKLCESSC